eukprot:1140281-Pelagomonas_calceolata.AAC.4
MFVEVFLGQLAPPPLVLIKMPRALHAVQLNAVHACTKAGTSSTCASTHASRGRARHHLCKQHPCKLRWCMISFVQAASVQAERHSYKHAGRKQHLYECSCKQAWHDIIRASSTHASKAGAWHLRVQAGHRMEKDEKPRTLGMKSCGSHLHKRVICSCVVHAVTLACCLRACRDQGSSQPSERPPRPAGGLDRSAPGAERSSGSGGGGRGGGRRSRSVQAYVIELNCASLLS